METDAFLVSLGLEFLSRYRESEIQSDNSHTEKYRIQNHNEPFRAFKNGIICLERMNTPMKGSNVTFMPNFSIILKNNVKDGH